MCAMGDINLNHPRTGMGGIGVQLKYKKMKMKRGRYDDLEILEAIVDFGMGCGLWVIGGGWG